ncbi:hypothetical protein DTO96_102529 [Ephemeroptericola cinctiostellae]|uniref:Phage tail tape measure protein domain-containing protein n=1 Tax=Ephemeroptericola cinctiostellae TaxID=2268024 RepID=A0A345DEI5_9BURK|nr:phage tail tape measure protein [Ephemeroptericola cinctiostellae]AXF86773.1 hypothetical protein DTO96_102529 [Ephemeroptericola cinctiostellae]
MSNPEVMVRIAADAARFNRTVNGASRTLRGFAKTAHAEFSRLKNMFGSVQGQMVGMGAGIGMTKLVMDAAQLQKETQLLKVATGGSTAQMAAWNSEMLHQQQITGTSVQSQLELSQSLQAAGLGMESITPALEPAARTMAVAKANADQLGKAMGVASQQFNIDLKSPQQVTTLLDQMLVAGRAGNAELENLPDIFARVGGRARDANMGLTDTLALVETLSKSEPQAERLATLTDSTLRVFTNSKYMHSAQKGTGVKFFNNDGSRRDPLVVLQEMHKAYNMLKTDQERMGFIDKSFGKADMDTQRGVKKLLDGDALSQLDAIKATLSDATGQAKSDLNEAISNSVDQTSRLAGALKEAANGFTLPVNDAINKGIKYLLDPKNPTPTVGAGEDLRDVQAHRNDPRFSGGEILAGGGVALAGLYGLSRLGTGLIGKLSGGALDLGKGVGVGKALQASAGVTPVYVVNLGDVSLGKDSPLKDVLPGAPATSTLSKALPTAAAWIPRLGGFAAVGAGAYEGYQALTADRASTSDKVHGVTKAVGGAVGGWQGASIGASAGGALGAALGSFVPVLGTAVGAAVGTAVGGLAGAYGGYKVGSAAGDVLGGGMGWMTDKLSGLFDGGIKIDGTSGTVLGLAMAGPIGMALGGPLGLMYDKLHAPTPPAVSQPPAVQATAGIGAIGADFATRWMSAGNTVAQQNAQALTGVTAQATAQQQAVGAALISQVGNTQIKGTIMVNVAPSSSLLNVTATASGSNSNTIMTANVGRMNTGAS